MADRRLDPLTRYREYAEFQFALDGEGVGLREAREDVAAAAVDAGEVRELDALVIEAAGELEAINPLLLQDDDARPLSAWWWHLGKIRRGEYPAERLPEHLRSVYSA
jgi:hypothetical protein